MRVSDLAKMDEIKQVTQGVGSKKEIRGVYIGDLLSVAMSKIKASDAWITVQTNVNVAAVASLADASCIIISEGFAPDEQLVKKAADQNIALFVTGKSAYDVVLEYFK